MTSADVNLPKESYVYLTYRCNLNCKHCYLASSPSNEYPEMPFDKFKKIIKELAEMDVGFIKLTGGEPFIHKDINKIISLVGDYGIKLHIETNGTLIDSEKINTLKKYQDLISSLGVSLDGASEASFSFLRNSGSFEKVVDTIKKLTKEGFAINASMSIHKKNRHELSKFIELASNLNIKMLQFRYINSVGRAKNYEEDLILSREDKIKITNEIVDLIEQYINEKALSIKIILGICPSCLPPKAFNKTLRNSIVISHKCNFPVFGILPDGKISVCGSTPFESPELLLGSAFDTSIEKLWRESKLIKKIYEANKSLEEPCRKCLLFPICRGSCRMDAYLKFKRFTAPNPECHYLYEENLFNDKYLLTERCCAES